MMSSMRGAASGGRGPRRGKGKSSNTQYMVLAGVGVAVIVAAVLLLSGGSKPKAKSSSTVKKTSSASASSKKSSSRPKASVTRTANPRETRREERARQREAARAARKERGSRRSKSGGYAAGGRSQSSPNTLRAIITDESGARLALVGERRLKPGDQYEGRTVKEVGADAIKLEYRQSEYTVRVGGSVVD